VILCSSRLDLPLPLTDNPPANPFHLRTRYPCHAHPNSSSATPASSRIAIGWRPNTHQESVPRRGEFEPYLVDRLSTQELVGRGYMGSRASTPRWIGQHRQSELHQRPALSAAPAAAAPTPQVPLVRRLSPAAVAWLFVRPPLYLTKVEHTLDHIRSRMSIVQCGLPPSARTYVRSFTDCDMLRTVLADFRSVFPAEGGRMALQGRRFQTPFPGCRLLGGRGP